MLNFGIRKSIGMGMTIIILKLLMTAVFAAIEQTLLSGLSATNHAFQLADHVVSNIPL